jgi:hypothetical protein
MIRIICFIVSTNKWQIKEVLFHHKNQAGAHKGEPWKNLLFFFAVYICFQKTVDSVMYWFRAIGCKTEKDLNR